MRFRCPKCGYISLFLYPSTEEEWEQSCPNCGNDDLLYAHLVYPWFGGPTAYWEDKLGNKYGEVTE